MATKSLVLQEESTAIVQKDLTCTVCLDRLKEPKLLPCLHTYCKACLERAFTKAELEQTITCPQCRSSHPIPEDGVGGFPDDRILENALEFQLFKESKQKDVILPCNMCVEDDPATAHCPTCGKFLCDFCARAHRRQVSFCDHRVVALEKLVSEESIKSLARSRYCTHHPEEVLKLYCDTCQVLICRDCSVVDHRDHDFGFAKTVRPEIQQKIEQAIKAVTTKQQEFQKHLLFIEDAEKTQDTYSNALRKQINREFDYFIAILESRRRQLLEQEETSKTPSMKQVGSQKQMIETTLANIASGLCYAERLCGCQSDTDMLAMSSEVSQRLTDLQQAEWDPNTHLTCSPPLVLLTTAHKHLVQAADLKAIKDLSLSIQSYDPERISSAIGQKLQLIVRIDGFHSTNSLIVIEPTISISVSDPYSTYYKTNTVKHAPVMSHESKESWLVEFTPLHAGLYVVSAGIHAFLTETEASPTPAFRNFWMQPQPSLSKVSYNVPVKGFFSIGARVHRGPDWLHSRYGDEDGGIGNKGTIVNKHAFFTHRQNSYAQCYQVGTSTVEEFDTTMESDTLEILRSSSTSSLGDEFGGECDKVYIRWDKNEKYGQYNCSDQHGPFLLELAPE